MSDKIAKAIKFRQWVVKDQKMSIPRDLEGWIDAYCQYEHDTRSEHWKEYQVVWMQFTGVQDRNGVDLYDGDVAIDLWRVSGHQTVVVFWSDVCSMFMIRNTPRTWSEALHGKNDRLEIIGNIYSNPELLESK